MRVRQAAPHFCPRLPSSVRPPNEAESHDRATSAEEGKGGRSGGVPSEGKEKVLSFEQDINLIEPAVLATVGQQRDSELLGLISWSCGNFILQHGKNGIFEKIFALNIMSIS